MRAALVKPPNLVVSFPGDPAPLAATGYPCEFKNSWRVFTSLPSDPEVRFALKTCTAALVTESVVVPSSTALTLASVAASTLKETSTSRIAWTCEVESPEAAAAEGVEATVVVVVVVVVVGVVGVVGVDVTVELDELGLDELGLDEPEGAEPPLPPAEQSVEDGVMVTVTAVPVGA